MQKPNEAEIQKKKAEDLKLRQEKEEEAQKRREELQKAKLEEKKLQREARTKRVLEARQVSAPLRSFSDYILGISFNNALQLSLYLRSFLG